MFFLFLQLHSVFYSCNFIISFFTVLLSHIFYFDKIKKAIFTMSQLTENIKFHFTFSLSEKAHFENLLLIPPMCNSHYDVNCIYFETFVGICCNVDTTYFVFLYIFTFANNIIGAFKNFAKRIKTAKGKIYKLVSKYDF